MCPIFRHNSFRLFTRIVNLILILALTTNACKEDEFECPSSTVCIPENMVCDSNLDCPGGEDEDIAQCQVCNEFSCGDRICIPNKWKCDGEEDCANGSDEFNCPSPGPCNDFSCSDGKCIPNEWVCDDWIDCSNDELNCPCKGFECVSDNRCIPSSYVCNRHVDCADASDEVNCTCKDDEIYCGVCVNPIWVCDYVIDCPDGSDEHNCNYTMSSKRKSLEHAHKRMGDPSLNLKT